MLSKTHLAVIEYLEKEFPYLNIEKEFSYQDLRFDIRIPSLRMFIEIQGIQHYKKVSFFHKDAETYLDAIRRDAKKKQVANGLGYSILYIDTNTDFEQILFEEIQKADALSTIQEREGIIDEIGRIDHRSIAKDKGRYPLKIKTFYCPVCHMELSFERGDNVIAVCCGITFNKVKYKKEKCQKIFME